MAERFATGIEPLDRRLSGGLPTGSLVALTAAPRSRADRLLAALAARHRTLYLTVSRAEAMIEEELATAGVEQCVIRRVDATQPLEHVDRLVSKVPEQTVVIVDPLDPLERAGDGRFAAFLNALRAQMAATGSVGVLRCLEGRSIPARRDLTEYAVDGILSVATEERERSLATRVTIPKFRGAPVVTEPIELPLDRTEPTATINEPYSR